MTSRIQRIGATLAGLLLAGLMSAAMAADKPQTWSGEVSDAMCGAKHMGPAAACTRGCVAKGSKYAFVVGDKVYTLETSDKAALATLDKLAGDKAKVTGVAKGDTIQVTSVAAGS
jgi:hypothetical protein